MTAFEFRDARIVYCNKGAGTGNLFGYEGQRIISGEEGLGKVGGVDAEVIKMAADLLPPDGGEGDGAFGG